MTIHIENDESERLLADIAARKAKDPIEVLLELLRAEWQVFPPVWTNGSTKSERRRASCTPHWPEPM